ncbi:MAG TPA: glycosyltransferase family 2 protein [Chloroflexota bacterium]|nr:glycosyltransferase family 2 protein [Chloroflexota bacterium]
MAMPRLVDVSDIDRPVPEAVSRRIIVAIPCLNEERNIGSLVIQARRWASEVVVVDDGSTDETALIAEEAGATVIRHAENQGKGAALNSAFGVALGRDADVLVVMDGDGQHRAEGIPNVAAPVLKGEADIVVGSRHLQEGGIPRVRRVGQTMVTAATNLGSGVNVTDSQSGFRAFSRKALESMTFSSRGFAVESEMQFLALDRGLVVVEVPIEAVYVDPPKRNVFRHGLVVIDGVMRLVGMHRPLLFFAMMSLAMWLAGSLMALWALDMVSQGSAAAAIAPTLGAIACLVLGVLAVFAGVLLHSIRAMMMHLR